LKIAFPKYPIDIAICLLWSLVLIPVVLFDLNQTVRIILGLPAILFIPGYILIFTLFPTAYTEKGIDIIERIALSFGLSIAVVPLIGLGLNYTPWGIRLFPILTLLICFIILMSLIAIYRWYKTADDERFIVSIDVSLPKNESRLDQALTVVLALCILIAVVALVYVIITPRTGEQFTEFYILGPNGIADDYPRNLSINENASVIVGVVNHEYKMMNYTIEIWSVNQSMMYNKTTNENETIYHHMWFIDSIQISLNHIPVDIEEEWQPQWEKNWSFSLTHTGLHKLCFILEKQSSNNYEKTIDYASIAYEKINNAYRETHLWISVSN
jgi:uncharacterized membrane protein